MVKNNIGTNKRDPIISKLPNDVTKPSKLTKLPLKVGDTPKFQTLPNKFSGSENKFTTAIGKTIDTVNAGLGMIGNTATGKVSQIANDTLKNIGTAFGVGSNAGGNKTQLSEIAHSTPRSAGDGASSSNAASANSAAVVYDKSAPGDNNINWQNAVNAMYSSILNDKFSYDAASDPRYALAQEYAQHAMKNQMAESAILSGGYGNSYAAASGQQVYTDYMDQAVNDMEDRAYSRWANEHADKYNQLGVAMQMEDQAYNRAQDAKEDARYEAQNAYTQISNFIANGGKVSEINPALLEVSGLSAEYWSAFEDKYASDEAMKTEVREWEQATTLAQYGNFDGFEKLGIDMSEAKELFKTENEMQKFAYALEIFNATGETDMFAELGLGEDTINGMVDRRNASLYAEAYEVAWMEYETSGSTAALEKLGVDVTRLEEMKDREDVEYAMYLAINAGDTSMLGELGIDTTKIDKQWSDAVAPKGSGGGGTTVKTEEDVTIGTSGRNVYEQLFSAGATDYGMAYQILRDAGYGVTDAKEYASYYGETFYPDYSQPTELFEQLKNLIFNAYEQSGEDAAWDVLNNYVLTGRLKYWEAAQIADELGFDWE